jgi:hypothetical protein
MGKFNPQNIDFFTNTEIDDSFDLNSSSNYRFIFPFPMLIWQADFYRRPLQDTSGQPLWELLICDPSRNVEYLAFCPQSNANSTWLTQQLQQATETDKPDVIWVFRPQSLSLIQTAATALGIRVEPNRRTSTLKQWLQQRSQEYSQFPGYTNEPYKPIDLDKPPPVPIPENLWGEVWRFATLPAKDIVDGFSDRPIPILEMPDFLYPINLGLPSTVRVPGIVINGGRQSMQLARWLAENQPVSLHYIPGSPDGLILEAGLLDRWVLATFEDAEVSEAAKMFTERKQLTKGLHFLLVQPDDSGMTYTGFWLLRPE